MMSGYSVLITIWPITHCEMSLETFSRHSEANKLFITPLVIAAATLSGEVPAYIGLWVAWVGVIVAFLAEWYGVPTYIVLHSSCRCMRLETTRIRVDNVSELGLAVDEVYWMRRLYIQGKNYGLT